MKKAFSLIELSIAILVIGILIYGTIKGSNLVYHSKIVSARSLTASSPVEGIKDLVFWFETSRNESFLSSESEDKANVSLWIDINKQSPLSKYYFRKEINDGISYVKKGIGGLPSIRFSPFLGYSAFHLSTSKTSTIDTAITSPQHSYTMFVVKESDGNLYGAFGYLIMNGANGNGYKGRAYREASNGVRAFIFWQASNTGIVSPTNSVTTNPEILSITQSASGEAKLFVNGKITISSSTIISGDPTLRFTFGGFSSSNNSLWSGLVSEFIFYQGKLKDSDRKAIEDYLAQKYNINFSN